MRFIQTISVVLFALCTRTVTFSQTINGGWTQWSLVSSQCNVTCGGGSLKRVRTCANPAPQNNGSLCQLNNGRRGLVEYKLFACNQQDCATSWSSWSNCSVQCDRGVETRRLMCGELQCAYSQRQTETRTCNTWNKTSCPSPCLKTTCPEYSICEDKSTERYPLAQCKCTMGYKMNKAKTSCLRPPPPVPTPRPIPSLAPEQKVVAVVVTKTASTILITIVGATLGFFLLLRIFTPDRVIQMNMEIAIMLAHVFLMFPPETTENPQMCRVVSILVHFFFTVCFMFMLLECVHMYSLVAYVVKKEGLLSRGQNVAVGWAVPTLIVLVTLCFEYDHYGGSYHCWLQMNTTLLAAQLLPLLAAMAVSVTLIEAAGAADYPPLTDVDVGQRLSARISQRSNLIIIPLVFASWLVGALSEYEQNLPLYGSFSALNAVAGAAIFFFHCTGNQQVRAKLMRAVRRLKRIRG